MSSHVTKYSFVAALLSLSGLPFIAQAADWKPDRPVTMVVPYAAGGGTDATARAVARSLSEQWKQPVIVENQSGADGLLGTRRVMDAKGDGYTLLMQVPSLVLMKYLSSSKGIDPLSKLTPISALADSPTALVVSGLTPVKTVQELIKYCKTNTCSAGSGENASKIRSRWFTSQTGLDNVVLVNYRGTSPIVSDLLNGSVTMAFTGITAALPHHKAGKLRIIMTSGPRRASAVPEVPSVDEVGLKGHYSVTWYGLFAPKDTPSNIVHGIANAVKESGKDPGVKQAIEIAGADPVLSGPKEFAEDVARDDKYFREMVKRFPIE